MYSDKTFQNDTKKWTFACFGEQIALDKYERNHRFTEEALELVQSLGATKSEVLQLVDYVFNRPVGEPKQEVGGVMVTLAALCNAHEIDMEEEAKMTLVKNWEKIEKIRAKHQNKPKFSPLPA